MAEQLPSDFLPFGHVVGRVIRAVGDTDADPDSDPEAIPVTGKGLVRFTPLELTRVVTGTVPSTWVQQETIAADLDSEGFLALSGARGLLLWPGAWKVSAGSASAFSFPAFTIKVTAAHTIDSPLDLWTAAPYSPPPGATVTTLVVPAGGTAGQLLVWNGAQLEWQDRPADGKDGVTPPNPVFTATATTLAAGSNATATVGGTYPNLTLALGIPAGQPTAYQIVGAGRPDVTASMTTDVQAQVAAAPIGATFTSTDGASVGAWQWQKLPSGWVVTSGDTKLFSVVGLAANGWAISIAALRRNNNSIRLSLSGLDPASATSTTLATLPVGFRSDSANTRRYEIPMESQPIYITGGGPVIAPTGKGLLANGIATLGWDTSDAWPTVLPS